MSLRVPPFPENAFEEAFETEYNDKKVLQKVLYELQEWEQRIDQIFQSTFNNNHKSKVL